MIEFLFNLLIKPLVIAYELIFGIVDSLCNDYFYEKNYLFCIFIVSLVVNVITYPLYKRANELQELAIEKKKSMAYWTNHIKRYFNGDMRYFMLSTYYRQQNYKPIYAIKESISLLLQVPFFAAAYIFFFNATILNTASISIFDEMIKIESLGLPDRLLLIDTISINVIPILMTLINFISCSIYTKNLDFKDKMQPYILAIIFLIILYNSPSALVIYWTFNNLISLIKIIYLKVIRKHIRFKYKNNKNIVQYKNCKYIFALACTSFILLSGIIIPSEVIKASAHEFSFFTYSPYNIIFYTLTIFSGLTLYIAIFYSFAENKYLFARIFFMLVLFFTITHFFHGNNFGLINTDLAYDIKTIDFTDNEIIINLLFLFFLMVISLFSWKIKKWYLCFSFVVMTSLVVLSANNLIAIKTSLSEFYEFQLFSEEANVLDAREGIKRDRKLLKIEDENNLTKIADISKTGKNIFIFVLDRCIGAYLSYCLEAKPELKEMLAGFIFYPNTISFGPSTIVGAPGLYGGYEYIPYEKNKNNLTRVESHNQALTIMPKLFSDNDFNVVVSELPYPNYSDSTMEPLFNNIKNVKDISLIENIDGEVIRKNINNTTDQTERNFVFYTFMKMSPVLLHENIYNDGLYYKNISNKEALIYRQLFLKSFNILKNLKNLFNITENFSKNVFIIHNETTHEPNYLPYPDYYPYPNAEIVADENIPIIHDGEVFNGSITHLDSQVSALLQVKNFIDFLKENDVFDNSKIIITADHGCNYRTGFDIKYQFEEINPYIDNNGENLINESVLYYNPILLVKEYNSYEYKISDDFMTNADVPYIAMKDDIENIINPYTGNIINEDYKENNNIFYIAPHNEAKPRLYANDIKYIGDRDEFFRVLEGKNIFNLQSWSFDFDNKECIDNGGHIFIKHEKNYKKTCGINYLQDIYECEKCKKMFYDSTASRIIKNANELIIDVPHELTDYVKNNDESENNHGTKTAFCIYGCGLSDTIPDPDTKIGHSYISVASPATIYSDGLLFAKCSKCNRKNENFDEKVISKIKNIVLDNDDYIYDSKEIKPNVIIYDLQNNIIDKENYQLRYRNTYRPGKGNVSAVFNNDLYAGELYIEYIIHPTVPDFKIKNDKKNTFTLSIKNSESNVKGYILQVSDNPNFIGELIVDKKVKKSTNNEYQFNASKKKKLYVRVASYVISDGDEILSDFNIKEVN